VRRSQTDTMKKITLKLTKGQIANLEPLQAHVAQGYEATKQANFQEEHRGMILAQLDTGMNEIRATYVSHDLSEKIREMLFGEVATERDQPKPSKLNMQSMTPHVQAAIKALSPEHFNDMVADAGAANEAEVLYQQIALLTRQREEARKLLQDLQETFEAKPTPKTPEELILDLVQTEPQHIDALHVQSHIPIPALHAVLLQMEFAGKIQQRPGKIFARA
jgi:hypothetical protein